MKVKEMQTLSRKFSWKKVAEESCDVDTSASIEGFVRCHFAVMEKLLDAWAKGTKHWRADICYEIVGMIDAAKELDEAEYPIAVGEEYPLRMIGIRENGVDHPEFIECRLNQKNLEKYKSVYKVTFLKDRRDTNYTLKLYKMTKTA